MLEDKRKEISDGGIIIPEQSERELLGQGVVLAIGPKVQSLEVGCKVIYSASSAVEIENSGNVSVLISEDDIWAKL